MYIKIETQPHHAQRYDSAGDWQTNEAAVHFVCRIDVSEMPNEDFEFLVGLHEMIESYLCKKHGVPQAAVDAFDLAWQPHDGYTEPGDDPAAPYFAEHQFALDIEDRMMRVLGVRGADYEKALDGLG